MIRLQLLVGKVQDTAPPYNSRQKEQLIEFRNSIFQTVNIFLPVDVIGTQRYVEMSVKQGIAVGSLPVKCLSGQSDLQLINQAKTFTPMRADTHQSQKRITKDTHVSSIFVAPVVPIISPIFPFAFAHGSSL